MGRNMTLTRAIVVILAAIAGVAGYSISESDQTSLIEAVGLALPTLGALWLVIRGIVRKLEDQRRERE